MGKNTSKFKVFSEVEEIKSNVRTQAIIETDDSNEILWHYTSVESAVSILQSGQIWASQLGSMNDSQEISFPLHTIRDYILDAMDNASYLYIKGIDDVDPSEFEFDKQYLRDFLYYHPDLKPDRLYPYELNLYASCFCAERDSTVQWHGYASNSGVALGFDKHKLRSAIKTQKDFSLKEVVYPDSFNEIQEDITSRFTQTISTGCDIWSAAYQILFDYLPVLKSAHFAHEKEWRVVLTQPWQDLDHSSDVNSANAAQWARNHGIKYRVNGSLLIPYVAINLGGSGNRMMPALRSVLLGPTNSDIQQWKPFLQQLGYKNVVIVNSGESESVQENSVTIEFSNSPLRSIR
ncbi:DUF2971 domain-containing protein [Arcanobacterium bovis]|uniref:DUF2971 domain-containing protein n=1 Tax=Arcanobacterium bovis TaxID=2529275 RepID=UPI0019D5034A|nr:DUF2971 domain-containing protein [Arcanobacterium bovis]